MDFADLVRREDFSLAHACLLLARDEHEGLDVGEVLRRMEAWAADVRRLVAAGARPHEALRQVLFEEAGFRGNVTDYYDPENSYLDRVVERRVGLPITLSIVYLEVARLAGIPVVGVALPGHFVVKHAADERIVDPFRGGRELAADEAQSIVDGIYDGRVRLGDRSFDAAPARDILTRVLKNLKNAYLRRGDAPRALRTVERILDLNPFEVEEFRDRGLLLHAVGRADEARGSLERYLETMPTAPDAEAVRRLVATLGPATG